MPSGVGDIVELYEIRGAAQYGGEAINQLEHALQCAQLAAEAGSTPELVAASLLHDLGHLLARDVAAPAPGTDDLHQYLPVPFLRGRFSSAVIEPILIHVEAKRYLCCTEPGYYDALSPASKRSLALQGGPLTPAEAAAFAARPHAQDAVRLRRWDDKAKIPGRIVPGIEAYRPLLERLAQ